MSDTSVSTSFRYVRESFDSKLLKGPVHCGIVRFTDDIAGTMYFFHGSNGDDRQAVNEGLPALIQGSLLERIRNQRIQIVLPDVGRKFLQGKYSDYFFEEVIPFVEKGTGTVPERRWIGGVSMGGQSALNAFLRRAGMFRGVGTIAPTLVDFDFFDPAQYAAFVERNSLTAPWTEVLLMDLREFPNRSEFLKYDPLTLAREPGLGSELAGKVIRIDTGSEDEFGLAEGSRALSRILSEQGVEHRVELIPGGRHDFFFAGSRFPLVLDNLIS